MSNNVTEAVLCLKTFVTFALRENKPYPKCKHRKAQNAGLQCRRCDYPYGRQLKIRVCNVEDVITRMGDREGLHSIC